MDELTARLLNKMPGAIAFFVVPDDGMTIPGVVLSDGVAWIFEGGEPNPRPITQEELAEREAQPAPASEVAELLGESDWAVIDALGSKKNKSSTDQTKLGMTTDDSKTKDEAMSVSELLDKMGKAQAIHRQKVKQAPEQ